MYKHLTWLNLEDFWVNLIRFCDTLEEDSVMSNFSLYGDEGTQSKGMLSWALDLGQS